VLLAGTYADANRAVGADVPCLTCTSITGRTNTYTEEEGSDAEADCNGGYLCRRLLAVVSLLNITLCTDECIGTCASNALWHFSTFTTLPWPHRCNSLSLALIYCDPSWVAATQLCMPCCWQRVASALPCMAQEDSLPLHDRFQTQIERHVPE
jgi:hypothetical protein